MHKINEISVQILPMPHLKKKSPSLFFVMWMMNIHIKISKLAAKASINTAVEDRQFHIAEKYLLYLTTGIHISGDHDLSINSSSSHSKHL